MGKITYEFDTSNPDDKFEIQAHHHACDLALCLSDIAAEIRSKTKHESDSVKLEILEAFREFFHTTLAAYDIDLDNIVV